MASTPQSLPPKTPPTNKSKISAVDVRSFGKGANIFFNIIVLIFALSCLLPFFFVVIISLTEEALTVYGYQLWPKAWSISAYQFLFENGKDLLRSLGVTVFITVVGTLINTTITSTFAYSISRKNFRYRRFFTIFCLITMLFAPGMVANYIVMTSVLNLQDTIWALILPMAMSPFNAIVMRTFFKRQVSDSIIEAARVDGASELRILVQIVLPLAVPGIATISLFAALGFWNDWFNALLYIQNDNLVPLQYFLMRIQANIEMLTKNLGAGAQYASSLAAIPKEAVRMAMVVVSTVPIVATYPFFQKYFVKGLTIGGVKE